MRNQGEGKGHIIRPRGRIVVFYSYKGGTGRSMALANIAWILASNGQRVLAIDWDLEAPGLHRYFQPFLDDKTLTSSDGLIDFLVDFAAEAMTPLEKPDDPLRDDWYIPHADILRYAVSLNYEAEGWGTLDFVPAGRQGPSYGIRVNSFNWQHFYERLGGGRFLEASIDIMKNEYDYILIDSRTGISDTSGICTVQMPDDLVVCFTLNHQSIEGAGTIAEFVDNSRNSRRDESGKPGVRIFPVPMRVERGAEKDRLNLAREAAWDKFSPFLAHLPREEQETYRKQVEIPYEAFYAFEEVLATLGDQPGRPDSLLASFERLTAYLTNGKITRFKPLLEPERLRLRSLFIRPPKKTWEPVMWNVPYPRNPNFTGREAILKQLSTALASGTPAALTQAIAGLGGVGKTQTAVEYAYRYCDHYRAVLWVRADTETNLVSGARELAEVLSLPEKDESDSTKVAAAVRRWLGREPGYLLILDNADDPALVKPYLPFDPKGHVLLTSRASNFDVLGIRKPIGLPVLTPDEALEFLVKRTGREEPFDPAEQGAARILAEKLGYLPLALEQAAAYMVEYEEAFTAYLDIYNKLLLKSLDEMGPVMGEYPETVRTIWKRSFNAVAEASPASMALLRLSAFFAPDAIPYELILEGASELGEPLASALTSPPGGDFALNEILTPLARHSLVRRVPEARTYSVHRLVQAVLLDELTDATCRDFAERAIKALNRAFPDRDYANWPRRKRLMPHALALWGWLECFDKGFDLRLMSSLNDVSGIPTKGKNQFNVRGIPTKGKDLIIEADETIIVAAVKSVLHFRIFNRGGQVVVDTDEKRLTEQARQIEALRKQLESLWPPHELTSSEKVRVITAVTSIVGRTLDKSKEPLLVPEAARLLNQAGYYLYLRARYAEAEPLLRRALAIWEALGPDHPDTATSLNNLGVLLQAQGRYYGEAEPLLKRALEIREAALGPDHPDTAISLNNLALLLQAQGRFAEAEPLFRQALEIRTRALPPDHPDIVYTLNDLAGLLRDQGRYGEAEPLFRQALEIREQALRPDHPDTATSLNNLGALLLAQGRFKKVEQLFLKEAEPLLRRALEIREAALGPDHPDTAISLNHLGVLLRAQGRFAEAEPLHHRALTIREKVLRSGHPDIAQSLNNLAESLRAQGRFAEAEPLYRRALEIRKAALGPEHYKTAYILHNLAESLRAQDRFAEVEPLYRRALAIFETKLGPEHPFTVTCRANLATFLSRPDRGRARTDEAPMGGGTMAEAPRVFLSYSHDSAEHADRVLALADALRHSGLEVILDQYVHPAPDEGWPRWMDTCIDEANFVLMICTETYRRRVIGQEQPGKGRGVRWEEKLIYNRIYNDKPSGSRFIPVLLEGSEPVHIPGPVQGHTFYRISHFDLSDAGYEGLYRHLTGQAPHEADRDETEATAEAEMSLPEWHSVKRKFQIAKELSQESPR